MSFTEDLSLFFADFAVPVTAGPISGPGILDMPTEIVADGTVLTTDYRLTVLTSDFGHLIYGDTVLIDNTTYTVRETMQLDDGKLSAIMLMR